MAIPERVLIDDYQDLAVLAAVGGETNLVPQWPLNPIGKNSEYVAR